MQQNSRTSISQLIDTIKRLDWKNDYETSMKKTIDILQEQYKQGNYTAILACADVVIPYLREPEKSFIQLFIDSISVLITSLNDAIEMVLKTNSQLPTNPWD